MEVRIRIKGHLDPTWQSWFAPLQIDHEAEGTTLLSGSVPDQAALYGVLLKIHRLGLALIGLETGETMNNASTQRRNEMNKVTSKDGTTIAYEHNGAGSPLIIVDGALCSRAFGPSAAQSARLADHFTVYIYDRRGRGKSTDTAPYAVEREIKDLAGVDRRGGWLGLRVWHLGWLGASPARRRYAWRNDDPEACPVRATVCGGRRSQGGIPPGEATYR